MEGELALAKGLFEEVDELAAKHTTEDCHRCEEEFLSPVAPRAMNPAGPAGSQSASGHHAMDVGMVHQILAPRVEHYQ